MPDSSHLGGSVATARACSQTSNAPAAHGMTRSAVEGGQEAVAARSRDAEADRGPAGHLSGGARRAAQILAPRESVLQRMPSAPRAPRGSRALLLALAFACVPCVRAEISHRSLLYAYTKRGDINEQSNCCCCCCIILSTFLRDVLTFFLILARRYHTHAFCLPSLLPGRLCRTPTASHRRRARDAHGHLAISLSAIYVALQAIAVAVELVPHVGRAGRDAVPRLP